MKYMVDINKYKIISIHSRFTNRICARPHEIPLNPITHNNKLPRSLLFKTRKKRVLFHQIKLTKHTVAKPK